MHTKLSDLNNVILEIIGDYVNKENLERVLIKEEHKLNGKTN